MTLTVAPVEEQPAAAQTPVQMLRAPEDVEAWLRSLAPDAVCGYAASAGECPLARYLITVSGSAWASVGTYHYHVVNPESAGRHILPRWAQLFVVGVDAIPRRLNLPLSQGITAQQALEVLTGARRREASL